MLGQRVNYIHNALEEAGQAWIKTGSIYPAWKRHESTSILKVLTYNSCC